MNLRAKDKLYLLDYDEMQIIGAKLPSIGQVLRVFLYNVRKVKLNVRRSANLVIQEVEILWRKARIPTRAFNKCVEKIVSLFNIWRKLQKNCKRQTPVQKKHEQDFLDNLDDLFDIAHANAMDTIKIKEDKLFLINQRKKGRPGSMIGGDQVLADKEKRKVRRQEIENRQLEIHNTSFSRTYNFKKKMTFYILFKLSFFVYSYWEIIYLLFTEEFDNVETEISSSDDEVLASEIDSESEITIAK